MSRVYVFLAEGFEEIEGLTVVDILRRGGIDTATVSIGGSCEVRGSHDITVKADLLFEESDYTDAQMLVLPGGMPGTNYLGAHEGLKQLLLDTAQKGGKIAAICAAPSVLGDLGILKGKPATCYPGCEGRLAGAQYCTEEVVTAGNITTSRGMGTAIPFSLELLAQLAGEEESKKISDGILFRMS